MNTYTTGDQRYPAVAAAADSDDFVVAWRSAGSSGADTDQTSIQGQRYMPEPSFAQSLAAMLTMVVVLARRRLS